MAALGRLPQKGERIPGSGRKKGVKNKDTKTVEELLAAINCNPLQALAEIGKEAREKGELSVAARCYGDICKYVHPQRKAVDVTGSMGISLTVITGVDDNIIS